MTDDTVFNTLLIAVFVLAPLVLGGLMFSTAPYGRHQKGRGGPGLPSRLGWVVMESPAVLAFGYFYMRGSNAGQLVPLILLALWFSHYVQRTFVYPFLMRVRPGDVVPLGVVAMGFLFNTANAYLNATWISALGDYQPSWLMDPRFVVGVGVFAAGFFINRHADYVLRNLRAPGDTGYKIPHGGLYKWISCPNYFGELLTWIGWTVATWSLAGLSFVVFTSANLVPRALSNHRWYRRQFDEYPSERRAIVPYVL